VGGAPTGVGGRAAVGGAAGGRAESHPHASITAPPRLPHYPSKLAREGRIRNFVPNFGIEDRGDGGGVVGLAPKPEALEAQLTKYAAAPA